MGEPTATRSHLPTGTVTFVFTDIEGSTKLAHSLGDGFVDTLERHQRILRDVFTRHAGVEVSTEGDAFFIVFQSALDAVDAAAEVQRALSEHDWDGPPIRVRIGMHTGRGTLGGDNYAGIDVHRAARIGAASHGGQVVMSRSTAELVRRDLRDGLELADLGEHVLKDIEHPEQIFQLSIEGLPNDFPPLKTLSARPNNLPVQLSTFIDRPEEVAAVRELLLDSRLVTLTGPGGTGKTRLSFQVAERCLGSFKDGVFVALLAAVVDPSHVSSSIATALGVQEEGTRPMNEVLAEHLETKQLLLILDNFEQVLDASAVVGSLLSSAPELKILVTSRAPLKITGEREYPVPPMSLPDPDHLPSAKALEDYESVALFLDRARGVKPDFAITDANARTIAKICNRLDGLPLAIELAAARVRILTPDDLYKRLETCLNFLEGGRDLSERQRTLRGAIEWSFDLLDEPEKKLFRRLAIFVGGWSFEAAEAVCEPGEFGYDAFSGIESLLDKSLIRRHEPIEGITRFRMLQTIREYALERLEAAEGIHATAARHAAHYSKLARDQLGSLTANLEAREQAFLEDGNFRAALDHIVETGQTEVALAMASALWRYWHVVGHLREGRERLQALLARGDAASFPEARAQALTALGSLAYWQSDFETTRHNYELALEAWREIGDEAGIAEAYYNLGFLETVAENYEEGARCHRESRALYQKVGNERGAANTLLGLGINRALAGDYEAARDLADQAFAFFDPLNEWFGLMMTAFIRYQVLRFTGEYESGAKLMVETFDRVGEDLDRASLATVLDTLSDTSAHLDRWETAVTLYAAGQRLKEEVEGAAPATLIRVGNIRELARKHLSEDEIEAAWAEGYAMSLQEAIAFATKEGLGQ